MCENPGSKSVATVVGPLYDFIQVPAIVLKINATKR
jgi:hypothetical protein